MIDWSIDWREWTSRSRTAPLSSTCRNVPMLKASPTAAAAHGWSRETASRFRSFNERAAINARLQGSAADIIRRAMTRMEDALAEKKLSAQMLLQVHDELIFEVPDKEVAATLPVVQRVMQDAPFPAVVLSLPLQVDARAADNWDEAH